MWTRFNKYISNIAISWGKILDAVRDKFDKTDRHRSIFDAICDLANTDQWVKAQNGEVTEFAVGSDTKVFAYNEFYNVATLEYFNIEDLPEGTMFRGNAFNGTTNLFSKLPEGTIIRFPKDIQMGDGQSFLKSSFLNCNLVFNGECSIGYNSFAYCKMKSVDMSQCTNKSIGWQSFGHCSNLESIILPPGLTSIGTQFLRDCPKLTYVRIPDTVTSIDTYSLAYGYIPGTQKSIYTDVDFGNARTTIPTVTTKTFHNGDLSSGYVIVPDALYDEWIAATNWTLYVDKIIKYSDYYA